jgi:hypothetical protein
LIFVTSVTHDTSVTPMAGVTLTQKKFKNAKNCKNLLIEN